MSSHAKPRRLFASGEVDDTSYSSNDTPEEMPSSESVVSCIVKFAHSRHASTMLRKIKDSKCRVKILLPSARRVMLCGDRYDILSIVTAVEHESIAFQKNEKIEK